MNSITQLIAQHFGVKTQSHARMHLARTLSEYFQKDASKIAFDILLGDVKPDDAYVIAMILGLKEELLYQAIVKSHNSKRSPFSLNEAMHEQENLTAELSLAEMERVRYHNSIGPHLKVITKGKVTQITFAALTYHNYCLIKLRPEITESTIAEQLQQVRQVVLEHVNSTPKKLPIFGEIFSYLYCPTAWLSYPINRSGKLTGLNQGDPRGNPVGFSVEGKPQKLKNDEHEYLGYLN